MAMSKIAQNLKSVSNLFSDHSLTQKAYLNAVASALDYASRLVVGFFITPMLVAGLGDFLYGVWRILERLVGYISPVSGRPTQVLKWTIANQQASTDYERKRRYVGSTVVIWALFLPLMVVFGGVLVWFAPYWLNVPVEFIWVVRWTAGILVVNLTMTSLVAVPKSVLEGENLGYKRMGLSALLVFLGGGLTWLALYLGAGLVGVAAVSLATTALTGVMFLQVVRTYADWFGVIRPSFEEARLFAGLSWWFLAWHLIMRLMMASDVVVLGMFDSVESVTTYSLTKYAPETVIEFVAIVVFGIAPGLGGIIGSRDLKKAANVRSEIMSLTWLVVTVFGSTILLWNWDFIRLWVGAEYYVGPIPTLLIVMVVLQLVLIRNDANIIDLTLRLRRKVLLGALSVAVSLVIAGAMVGYFRLGIAGVCLGFIAGRSVLSIGYPVLVGRFLGVPLSSQLRGVLRPAFVTLLLFVLAITLSEFLAASPWFAASGWIELVLSVGLTFGAALLLAFYAGLSGAQRRHILGRIRIVVTTASD